jgi:mannosyltransferase OCH1-like enzyme
MQNMYTTQPLRHKNDIVILSNKKYPIKNFYHSVIPLNIFQTWHTKLLPPGMKRNIELIKKMNPRFNYQLFDDTDCHDFIRDNFDVSVLNAFNKLIPGAYKADLWRYCVLYKLGGIYLDIKYSPANGFRFINLTESEHWVLDADGYGIYNALMVCKAGNPILLSAIQQIVEHTQTNFYGSDSLEPTGPKLLASFIHSDEKNKLNMKHSAIDMNNRFIFFHNYLIFKNYNGYLNENNKYKKTDHYTGLWNQRKIYH